MSAVSTSVRRALYDRADGRCEICTRTLTDAWHAHHRRPRAIGGSRLPDTNTLVNLLALCPTCHLERVEADRDWALTCGYLVRQGHDPARVAVQIHRAFWVFLTPEGTYRETAPDSHEGVRVALSVLRHREWCVNCQEHATDAIEALLGKPLGDGGVA